jgi:hypothetical protein
MSRYGSVSRTTLMNSVWSSTTGRQGRRSQTNVPPLNSLSVSAAAAFSTRLLRTAYTGKAMNVRRSSDNATQDIGFLNGVLDTTSLLSFVNNAGQPLNGMTATAAAAYSTRLVRSAYTGPCMNVRRESDNATQDIGFVNGTLDTASLLAFVGAYDGYVVTWYDQSGNGNHATQSTAAAQMSIALNGVVNIKNGRPALSTAGAPGSYLTFTTTLYTGSTLSGNMVFSIDNVGTPFGTNIMGSSATVGGPFTASTTAILFQRQTGYQAVDARRGGVDYSGWGFTSNVTAIYSVVFDNTNSTIWNNGGGASATASTGPFSVAAGNIFSSAVTGTVNEAFLFYSALSTADRNILEASQGYYYGIQIAGATPTFNGFVTTWYDQSGLGNNATQATAVNQPQIVASGVVTTAGSKPALKFVASTPLWLNIAGQTTTNTFSMNAVFQTSAFAAVQGLTDGSADGVTGSAQFQMSASTGALVYNKKGVISLFTSTLTPTTGTPQIASLVATNTTAAISLNGTTQSSGTSAANLSAPISSIGVANSSAPVFNGLDGFQNENVVFATNIADADRQLLERNQEAYYGIAGV